MSSYLFVVARNRLDLRDYWTRWFARAQEIEVTVDRREGERRQQVEPHEPERRRSDRRYRPAIERDLRATGFAIIHQGRRVLVVEDSEIVRDAVAMMLYLDGYEVDTARNRAEAVELLEQGSYDVIISDLGDPDVEGPIFYQELKQRRPDTLRHLIFMTGHAYSPEDAGFLQEVGVPVLTKPFTPEDLQEAVQRALATR